MEIVVTLIKALIIAVFYLGIGPGLGFFLNGRDTARRWVLGFISWWMVRPRSDFTLMLDSVDRYRGHAKGFEFNWVEAICIGLSITAWLEKRKDFRWFPPGLIFWLGWVALSCLSLVNALNVVYGLMPALKFAKMAFVYAGVFHSIHDQRDIKAMARGFGVALILQLLYCLFARYVQGGYRIIGWFEHQNPMAMWSYMCAFPLLGLALSKQTPSKESIFYLIAFGCAGLVVILSVSRAALAVFAVGTMVILFTSFLQGITARKAILLVVVTIGGLAAVGKAANTFMERMKNAGDDKAENDLRVALNKQSAAMLADHPWNGIGWNNYGLANSRPQGAYSIVMEDWERNRGRSIHLEAFQANPLTESFYWLLLSETGYLGFASCLLFIAVTVYYGIRSTAAFWKGPLGLFFLGLLVAFVLTYVHSRVERVLTQTKSLTTWIMFCGILARANWWRKNQVRIE
jgi:O-antigen ligase